MSRNKNKHQAKKEQYRKVNPSSVAKEMARVNVAQDEQIEFNVKPYKAPAGVMPQGTEQPLPKVAMDNYVSHQNQISAISGYNTVVFKGYAHYAQLYNMPEFRKIVDVMSSEMTRKWISLKSAGDGDVSDKIGKIEEEMKRLNVQSKISELLACNFVYGRGQLYISLKMPKTKGLVLEDPEELQSPLALDKAKIPAGGLYDLVVVEPIWTTAAEYESIDPLRSDYLEPTKWFVNGKTVHKDRLITIITNPVATFLKPAFNYGGLSLLQLVEPTINNWLAVRDSGKDLVKGSNIFVLKTNMSTILSSEATDAQEQSLTTEKARDLLSRIILFGKTRNNQGVMAIDKDEEEIDNVNVSMAGIAEMVTKYQEQPSQVTGIPVVKLTGNTPSGLNASSEGEIRVFYDMIMAMNESFVREPLQYLINVIQVSLYGEVDDNITFDFNPLYELTEKENAEVDEIKARTLATVLESQVITDLEMRNALKDTGNPLYANLAEIKPDDDDEEDEKNPEDKLNQA